MITKSHYYFFLPSNPYPLFSSVSRFNFFLSSLNLIKFSSRVYFFFNVFLIVLGILCWWLFYSRDFNLKGEHSYTLERGVKVAMLLFISSEVFFFFSFFWGYFHYFLSPILEFGLVWPPISVKIFNYVDIPLLNTFILLSSGVTVTLAHFAFLQGYRFIFLSFLFWTVVLGLSFSFFQILEYFNSFFCIRDSVFGSCFFVLTGFHGLHVLVGAGFLFFVLIISSKSWVKIGSLFSFELASWYWHFVDVVWIFLYFFIYFLG